MEYAVIVLVAYLLGSLPTGYLIVKWTKKKDIRSLGSGNIGATNVFRNFGWKLGLLTLVVDIFKGVAAIRSVDLIMEIFSTNILVGDYILAGSCVILGHFMPVWLNWKGGKAVATSLGVILALLPGWFSLVVVSVFVVIYVVTRKVSLGSLAAAVTAIFVKMFFAGGFNSENYESSIFIIAIVILIIFAHRENIQRLLKGSEPKT